MKKCPYCGEKYADDVKLCVVDQWLLADDNSSTPSTAEQTKEAPLKANEPYLTFPDYRWGARDAWKCLGMLLIFGLVWYGVYSVLYRFYPAFWRSGLGSVSSSLMHYTVTLLVVVYFARTETLAMFYKGFGLDKRPTNLVWFGIVAALVIRAFGHLIRLEGWDKGVIPSGDISSFKHAIGFQRYFFLIPSIILAPLFEEPVYRGFLFKAFRGSYLFLASVILIIAWTANTHWRQYSHSWTAALDLSLLTGVQCYLRERSGSLWDSSLCHFTFNFSPLFFSGNLR